MTVSEALREATQRLTATSGTARLDAELLMAHAMGVERSEMLLRHMADPVPSQFGPLIDRRAYREPVAYIVGHAEFFGRRFIVTPDVLIPRGDSESVIEAAVTVAPSSGRVLDMGTGSGALLVTLLAELPSLEGVGIDASLAALSVAAANAALNHASDRAQLLRADWHDADWADELGKFDLIIANPPYVESTAELDPDVRDFEPANALFSGEEGLDDYRAILPQLRQLLTETGVIVLEIGADQAEQVSRIAKKNGFTAQLRRDLAGRPRALILR